jgi:hypothetical protein
VSDALDVLEAELLDRIRAEVAAQRRLTLAELAFEAARLERFSAQEEIKRASQATTYHLSVLRHAIAEEEAP